MPHRWSRRRFVQGAGAVGLGLLAGCGQWPGQAQPAPKVARRCIKEIVARSPDSLHPRY